MDDLFSKAVDVLGPLQSQAMSAIDSTLNEFSPDDTSITQISTVSSIPDPSVEIGFAPSVIEAAKRVLNYWEELDIEGKKSTWDEQGVAISQFQETSTKNRKSLAEQTRAFKAGDKKDFVPLLKAYQAEIDSMTKRAKHAENSYLVIYKMLYDAPDVVPSLKAFVEMVDRISAAEQEARRCRQELEVTKQEASQARTLLANLRRLEERNAELEEEMEAQVESIVEEKKIEISKDLEAVLARESAIKKSLGESKEKMENLQREYDKVQSKLFDLEEEFEEKNMKKQDELERALEELEKFQERTKALEISRAELAAEVERLHSRTDADVDSGLGPGQHADSLSQLERSLNSKDKFISTMQEQILQLEGSLTAEKESKISTVSELQKELDGQVALCDSLRGQLAEMPSKEEVEELKKHNRVLQELVGSNLYEGPEAGEEELPLAGDLSSVLGALKSANRKLTSDLTSTRIHLSERESEVKLVSEKNLELEGRNKELEALVVQLEEDIVKGSGIQSRDSWKGDASSAMNNLLADSGSQSEEPTTPGGKGRGQEEDTMLEIVLGQRERFRKRVAESEEENKSLKEALANSAAESRRLQNDNVSLYEKIKFLEQYNRQMAPMKRVGAQGGSDVVVFGGASSGRKNSRYACFGVSEPGGFDSGVSSSDPQVANSGATEMRYRKLYEEKMNPFNEFHSREQERSYKNLRLHDKITLTGGRLLLSNKYGRLFAFFYTLLLHLFIFVILYQSSSPNTVVIQQGLTPVMPINPVNSTPTFEFDGNSTHTFADSVAEKMGTLIQKTRDLTARGSKISSEKDLKEVSENSENLVKNGTTAVQDKTSKKRKNRRKTR